MPVSREANPRLFVVGEIHGRPEPPQPSGPGRGVPGARIWCRETLTQPDAAQILFEPGDGSIMQRLNLLYNRAKHREP
jgi:hypothetical protein